MKYETHWNAQLFCIHHYQQNKTVLYTGVTNNLRYCLEQHKREAETAKKSFAGKYNCYHLIYYEHFGYIQNAIDREKEIKGWLRKRKEKLINEFNPEWEFLNDKVEE